jgi:hypothetical protein
MESQNKHMDDLSQIRSMMEKASKFISLSGLAGVLAGIYAIIGAGVAYWYFYIFLPKADTPIFFQSLGFENSSILFLLLLAALIFFFAFASAVILTTRNSKKKKLPIWDHSSKRLLINLAVPVIAGVVFVLALLFYGIYFLVVPATIIFYGLALINGGHFTFSDIKYLGYLELVIGFISLFLLQYALIIWIICFGVLHILYGIIMYFKYDKQPNN